MKRLGSIITAVCVAAATLLAHEGNEHIRGVVTDVSPQSITLQTTARKPVTLKISAKTTYQLGGKPAALADVKVGDRVVIDVPEKSSDALLIQIGTAPAAAQTSAKAAPSTKLDIALTTVPKPAKTGENTVDVTLKDAAGKPVADADVSVLFVMPAMPAMKMPEMRNEVKLKATGGGKYTGTGQLGMAGQWNATVSVKQGGKEVAQKKVVVTAR